MSENELRNILSAFEDYKNINLDFKLTDENIKVLIRPNENGNKEEVFFKIKNNKSTLDFIQPSSKILDILSTDLNFVKNSIYKINKVLIYKKGDIYTDYWNILVFKKKGKEFVDESGIFKGIEYKNLEEILKNGILTEIGLFQLKDISQDERIANFKSIQNIIQNISMNKNKNLFQFWNEENKLMDLFKILYSKFNKKFLPQINKNCQLVCLCKDSSCKECIKVKCLNNDFN